ncbi:hypothetical protein [Pseudoalteromonas sp. UBA2102]|uniref:hypothetical protein n=1 Tax=Pseudoalteromonas sp. UBA2102 TaxID=1947291 RepID=UPI00257DAD8C|nr:hypothetical protein [Pseudoalteromonas sp. UBA2102]
MKKHSLLLMASALTFFVGCTTTVPVKNFEDHPIPKISSTNSDLQQIEKGIVKACIKLGWECTPESEGVINGVLNIRTHQLTVAINFDETAYSVSYVSSKNLNYNGKKIHRQYVNWVTNLIRHIDAEMI